MDWEEIVTLLKEIEIEQLNLLADLEFGKRTPEIYSKVNSRIDSLAYVLTIIPDKSTVEYSLVQEQYDQYLNMRSKYL